MQGVAIQQNDLQVPEAAEGDRDVGDAVTGEIQADKRKVPQLWGWVREESESTPKKYALVLTSSALCSGQLVTSGSTTASALLLFQLRSGPLSGFPSSIRPFDFSSCPSQVLAHFSLPAHSPIQELFYS